MKITVKHEDHERTIEIANDIEEVTLQVDSIGIFVTRYLLYDPLPVKIPVPVKIPDTGTVSTSTAKTLGGIFRKSRENNRGSNRLPQETVDAILRLRAAGVTVQAVAEQLGISLSSVYLYSRKASKQKKTWSRQRLPDNIVAEVELLRKTGLSAREIAQKLGIGRASVDRIIQKLKNTAKGDKTPTT